MIYTKRRELRIIHASMKLLFQFKKLFECKRLFSSIINIIWHFQIPLYNPYLRCMMLDVCLFKGSSVRRSVGPSFGNSFIQSYLFVIVNLCEENKQQQNTTLSLSPWLGTYEIHRLAQMKVTADSTAESDETSLYRTIYESHKFNETEASVDFFFLNWR